MSDPNHNLASLLPWDTEFFGFRVARILPARLAGDEMRSALDWCRANAVRCIYFQADANDAKTVRLAEQNGFRLADIRVELEKNDPGREPDANGVSVRDAAAADLATLKPLFAGIAHFSRFAFDPRFPADAAERLYARWIERSVEGYADLTLVAETGGRVVGGITGHLDKERKTVQIGLLAVDESTRSKGVGRLLVQALCCRAAGTGATGYEVATQGRNTNALRFYNRNGFAVRSVRLWYHKWLDA